MRKLTKRETIMVQALQSFVQRGKNECTRNDILEQCGISKDKAPSYAGVFAKLETKGILQDTSRKLGKSRIYTIIDSVILNSQIEELENRLQDTSKMQTKEDMETLIQDETIEDLEQIFNDIMSAVGTIHTKISRFEEVKEDKDIEIAKLRRDVEFYKSKCQEYRLQIHRLQEKINELKW